MPGGATMTSLSVVNLRLFHVVPANVAWVILEKLLEQSTEHSTWGTVLRLRPTCFGRMLASRALSHQGLSTLTDVMISGNEGVSSSGAEDPMMTCWWFPWQGRDQRLPDSCALLWQAGAMAWAWASWTLKLECRWMQDSRAWPCLRNLPRPTLPKEKVKWLSVAFRARIGERMISSQQSLLHALVTLSPG